jgi:hypothetical protein
MEDEMSRSMSRRNEVKRLDALLALPLERFRRALTELTPGELEALETRIAVQSVKSRWERGGHGVARHRAMNDLGLLGRRAAATRREREARHGALTQLRLVEPSGNVRELLAAEREERAA